MDRKSTRQYSIPLWSPLMTTTRSIHRRPMTPSTHLKATHQSQRQGTHTRGYQLKVSWPNHVTGHGKRAARETQPSRRVHPEILTSKQAIIKRYFNVRTANSQWKTMIKMCLQRPPKLQQNVIQWNLYYRHYFKDAKRSDFVRNRDMEGDIDMDKMPLSLILCWSSKWTITT